MLKALLFAIYRPFMPLMKLAGFDAKSFYELAYWKKVKYREGTLSNVHYETYFTDQIGLDRTFYTNKRVLDVGCGPRGSLEWLNDAEERVGLDPLVESYRKLGIDAHKMKYVNAPVEAIPFPDNYFDVVTSINSLDHVDDLDKAIAEIKRVIKPNGHFIVLVDRHIRPTIAEPVLIDWNLSDKFRPEFEVVEEHHYEHNPDIAGSLASLHTKIPFDHENPEERYGVLLAKLVKLKS